MTLNDTQLMRLMLLGEKLEDAKPQITGPGKISPSQAVAIIEAAVRFWAELDRRAVLLEAVAAYKKAGGDMVDIQPALAELAEIHSELVSRTKAN